MKKNSLFKYMGANKSKTEQIKSIVNNATLDVLNQISNTSKTITSQSNTFDYSGNTGMFGFGFSQSNNVVLDLQVIQQSASSGILQANLDAKIKDALEQSASSIGYSKTDASTNTKITNSIKATITAQALNDLMTEAKNSNTITVRGNTFGALADVSQTNMANLASKLTAGVTNDIVAALEARTASETTTKQVATDPISNISKSFGDAFTSLVTMGMVFWIVLIVAGLAGAYLFKDQIAAFLDKEI